MNMVVSNHSLPASSWVVVKCWSRERLFKSPTVDFIEGSMFDLIFLQTSGDVPSNQREKLLSGCIWLCVQIVVKRRNIILTPHVPFEMNSAEFIGLDFNKATVINGHCASLNSINFMCDKKRRRIWNPTFRGARYRSRLDLQCDLISFLVIHT